MALRIIAGGWLAFLLTFPQASLAQGQSPASSTVKQPVYTYVEQMPELPGGGSNAAIGAAIQKAFVMPKGNEGGSVSLEFVVLPDGSTSQARVIQASNRELGAAVLAAVRRLPRFIPGKQNGQPVAVRVPLRFSCLKPQ